MDRYEELQAQVESTKKEVDTYRRINWENYKDGKNSSKIAAIGLVGVSYVLAKNHFLGMESENSLIMLTDLISAFGGAGAILAGTTGWLFSKFSQNHSQRLLDESKEKLSTLEMEAVKFREKNGMELSI